MSKPPAALIVTRTFPVPSEVVWAAVVGGFGDVDAYNPAIDRSEWVGDARAGVGAGRM